MSLYSAAIFFAALGLALLLTWMFFYRPVTGIFDLTDSVQLANLHTVMMYTFMISLNMFSILVYRTFYFKTKTSLKWSHAIISGLNIVMSLLGVFAMLKSHWLKGIPNFYSLHSWIGSLTNAFYLLQFSFGFITYLKPGLGQTIRQQSMPWHKLFGSFILVLAAAASITGMLEMILFQDKGDYAQFKPITFIVNFAALCVIIMTTIAIYLVQSKDYVRRQFDE